MKIIKSIQKRIQCKKTDRQAREYLANFWKLKTQGKTTPQTDREAYEIMQARIRTASLKTQCQELEKQIRRNKRKVFYVDYFMGFVISDGAGKVFFRGTAARAVKVFLRLSFLICWGILTNHFNERNEYVQRRFHLFFGVKRASKKTGFSEEFLIGKNTDVLLEK